MIEVTLWMFTMECRSTTWAYPVQWNGCLIAIVSPGTLFSYQVIKLLSLLGRLTDSNKKRNDKFIKMMHLPSCLLSSTTADSAAGFSTALLSCFSCASSSLFSAASDGPSWAFSSTRKEILVIRVNPYLLLQVCSEYKQLYLNYS